MTRKRTHPPIILAAPARPGYKSLLTGGDGSRKIEGPDAAPIIEALGHLCRRFKVQQGDWLLLAVTLAFDGGYLQYKKKTGAIKRWDSSLLTALWIEVNHWRNKKGASVTATFNSADFMENWRIKSGVGETSATLSARYYDAEKQPLPKMFGRGSQAISVDAPWDDLINLSDEILRLQLSHIAET